MVVLGTVLDVIVWKQRRYANLLIYYELISLICHGFLPLNYGNVTAQFLLFAYLWIYLLTACDMGPNIIASTLSLTCLQLCPQPIIYNESFTIGLVTAKILNSAVFFVVATVLSMTITYIAQIRGKMNKLMLENLNLFNKMNEGLIVISEKDKSLKFAS